MYTLVVPGLLSSLDRDTPLLLSLRLLVRHTRCLVRSFLLIEICPIELSDFKEVINQSLRIILCEGPSVKHVVGKDIEGIWYIKSVTILPL